MIIYETIHNAIVSQKALEKAKELEDYSPCFHSEDKGCELEDIVLMKRNSNGVISQLKCKHCKTHGVDVCNCGWEWHMHYDTNSLMLRSVNKTNPSKAVKVTGDYKRRSRKDKK